MNHLIEIESAILGAVLLQPEGSTSALEILKPNHFSEPNHTTVYKAIHTLYASNQTIDTLTVTQELKRMGVLESVGGAYYVFGLTNRIASAGNIEAHSRIIQQDYIKRKTAEIITQVQYKLSEPQVDCFDTISKLENDLSNLINGVIQAPAKRIDEVKEKVLNECKSVLESGVRSGIPCSIERLNLQTNGWQKGDLIIVAGRPGMGKTSAGLDFALQPALNKTPTAFFSLEMSKESLTGRALSMISQVNVQEIINKTLDAHQLKYIAKEAKALNNIPLFIDDTPALSLFELRNKARRLKRTEKIELIVVDYLQLMIGDNQNREQEISSISRGLKALAKELELPIIALSQLSRKCEDRSDKKPLLSDLRESGAIEQDADMVIFCHRPEYYGITNYQTSAGEINTDGLFMFLIAKFRNGRTGEVRARFIKENSKIDNY